MTYYEKYLKYKTKYIKLNNLIGSGVDTAKNAFIKRYKSEAKDGKELLKNILMNDHSKGFFIDFNVSIEDKLDSIFNQIVNIIDKEYIKEYIDWIIHSYINNTFGEPSSLENYGRFKEAISKYKLLFNNDKSITKLHEIKGLVALEKFIDDNNEKIQAILIKKRKDNEIKLEMKLLEEKGKDHVIKILETDKIIIYNPTNENGSRYYGRNTKWCTASNSRNMFNYYNHKGPLYIIQSKSNANDKFQLHIERNKYIVQIENVQLMDSSDKPVDVEFILDHFNDIELTKWFNDMHNKFIEELKGDIYDKGSLIFPINHKITFFNLSIKDIKGIFDYFIDNKNEIKTVYFNNFMQPLENIFEKLNNLKTLNIDNFNYPLGDSLKYLINLEELSLSSFNHPLGDSLNHLIKLKKLSLSSFKHPLGDSLKYLINLEELSLSSFNHPLGNSLNHLIKLKELNMFYYKFELDPLLIDLIQKGAIKFN